MNVQPSNSSRSTSHKEGSATVRIEYYRQKTYSDGSHPFMVCVTKDRERARVATGITLSPLLWNFEKKTFRKSLPQHQRLEIEVNLQNWVDKYTTAAKELFETDKPYTAKDVVQYVSDKRGNLRQFKLLSYFEHLISQFESTNKLGNKKVYQDVKNNLKKFIKTDDDVDFSNVTVKFCNEWETYMRIKGLNEVTMSVKFRTLRAVLNKAIADGYAKQENYPFARNPAERYRFQTGKFDVKTNKRAISRVDLQKIEDFQPEAYEGPYASLRDRQQRHLLAKHVFLFSYYCGGINFVDIALLKWSNINTDIHGIDRISYIRRKTGGYFNPKILPYASQILSCYSYTRNDKEDSYIFPILTSSLHKTAAQIHNRVNKVMSQINSDLKLIADKCGIKVNLTTYVARHTFATSLRLAGEEIRVISQAMGHTSEETTRIYLKELNTELIDSAYDKL